MPKFFAEPGTFDVAAADDLVWGVFRKRDLTQTSSRHGELISTEKVGAQLAQIFRSTHVITNRKDLTAHPDKAASPEDIAEEFLGDEPLLYSGTTPEEEAARDRVVSILWEYCSTSITSVLNKALSDTDGYILLQARVPKRRPRPDLRGVPRKVEARFLTQDFELIRDYGVNHGLEGWRRSTERFEALLKEFGDRQPALRVAIAKAVVKEIPSITGLLVHADVKAVAAAEASPAPDNPAEDLED